MPGSLSQLNQLADRNFRALDALAFGRPSCIDARVFSSSTVRLRRASSSLSQSSMFTGGRLPLSLQEQPSHEARD